MQGTVYQLGSCPIQHWVSLPLQDQGLPIDIATPISDNRPLMIVSYDVATHFSHPFSDDQVITHDVSSQLGVVLNDMYASLVGR
jgi:hypothetical protein